MTLTEFEVIDVFYFAALPGRFGILLICALFLLLIDRDLYC